VGLFVSIDFDNSGEMMTMPAFIMNIFRAFAVIGTFFYGFVLVYAICGKYKFFKARGYINLNSKLWPKYLEEINSKNAVNLIRLNYITLNIQTNKGKPHSAADFAKMYSKFSRENGNALKSFFKNTASEEDVYVNLEDIA
jgi:hypothetical protein